MDSNVLLDENAKNDWLKLVDRHKKKQKGLPALSTLNTNAGDVEHNVAMFNHMQPSTYTAANPVSGAPMGESVDSTKQDKIIIEYNKMPVEYEKSLGLYYDKNFGGYMNDAGEYHSDKIDFEYEVDKQDVLEVLGDNEAVQEEYWLEDMTAEEFDNVLENHFDEILEKYMSVVKDHFYDDAQEAAIEKYGDTFYEDVATQATVETLVEDTQLDDSFDMSLRTLL